MKQKMGNEEKKTDDEDVSQMCCICREKFADGDDIRRLPCMHIFHKDEIDTWLKQNHICPICRIPIEQINPSDQ